MKKIAYAQSGGPSSVINVSMAQLTEHCKSQEIELIGLHQGIEGLLRPEGPHFVRLDTLTAEALNVLMATPASALGSCRRKLPSLSDFHTYDVIFERLGSLEVDALIYNGGNDSADTCLKLHTAAIERKSPITFNHIPKTIDNDLFGTYASPGFASSASWLAHMVQSATLDMMSMRKNTQLLVIETMGRHCGWLSLAASLSAPLQALPVVVLVPEHTPDSEALLAQIAHTISQHGCCTLVYAEGCNLHALFHHLQSHPHAQKNAAVDGFGHQQQGGWAPQLAQALATHFNLRARSATPDYFQRANMIWRTAADIQLAKMGATGAFDLATHKHSGFMAASVVSPAGLFTPSAVPLSQVANVEVFLPDSMYNSEHFCATAAAIEYLTPLMSLTDGHWAANGSAPPTDLGPHLLMPVYQFIY